MIREAKLVGSVLLLAAIFVGAHLAGAHLGPVTTGNAQVSGPGVGGGCRSPSRSGRPAGRPCTWRLLSGWVAAGGAGTLSRVRIQVTLAAVPMRAFTPAAAASVGTATTFLTVRNLSGAPDELVAVRSPVARQVVLAVRSLTGPRRVVSDLAIPAHGTLTLSPFGDDLVPQHPAPFETASCGSGHSGPPFTQVRWLAGIPHLVQAATGSQSTAGFGQQSTPRPLRRAQQRHVHPARHRFLRTADLRLGRKTLADWNKVLPSAAIWPWCGQRGPSSLRLME